MSTPLYPEVVVPLTGSGGNAFAVLAAVSRALRKAGHVDAVNEFKREAMAGDYDHLLSTAIKYVEVL